MSNPKEHLKGLKIDNSKSIFSQKKKTEEEFNQAVESKIEQNEEFQKSAFILGSNFIKIVEDTTLPENKLQTTLSLEKETLTKLVEFAKVVNNTDSEPLGMGSVSLIILLFKSTLLLRDKINKLEFKNSQLEESVKRLQEKCRDTSE